MSASIARLYDQNIPMSAESNSSTQAKLISCARHGEARQQAFVCEHLLHGTGRGFFFDRADDDPHPDAWCKACEGLRVDNGGDWTEALTNQVNIQLVCDSCYQEIKQRNTALIQ
jgi:hypothetical protein